MTRKRWQTAMWYLWNKEVGSIKEATEWDYCPVELSLCVHAVGTLGECVPMGWIEAKDIRIWDRREERYQSEAERIGGGNPLFFILPHREMRELILRGLHLFFPLPLHLFLYFTTFAFWHALCFLILIFQSYIQKVFLCCHSPLAFCNLFSVLLFEFALSLILPHPSLQGLWVCDAW